MSTAEGVLSQINSCSQFFHSQGPLLSDASKQASMGAMARSMIAQIAGCASMSLDQASAINAAITRSAFNDSHKLALADAVNKRCLDQQQPGAPRGGRRCTQSLPSVTSFFTDADWAIFEAQGTVQLKICTMMDRLTMLGLSNPSEATVKHLAALIACVHCPESSADQLHMLVTEIKAASHARKGTIGTLQHLSTYPNGPNELPQELYQSAYAAGPPIDKALPQFGAILARVPLRVTNKALAAPGVGPPIRGHQPATQGLHAVAQLLSMLQPNAAHSQDLPPGFVIARGNAGPSPLRRLDSTSSAPLALAMDTREPSSLALVGAAAPAIAPATPFAQPPVPLTPAPPPMSPVAQGSPLQLPSGAPLWATNSTLSAQSTASLSSVTDLSPVDPALPKPLSASEPSGGTAHDDDVVKMLEEVAAKKCDSKPKAKAKAATKAMATADPDDAAAIGEVAPKGPAKAKAKSKAKAKAKAGGKPAAKAEAKAAAKASTKAVAKGKAKAKAKSLKTPSPKGPILLGCGKCRGSHKGCSQCRNPSFGGARWQK